MPTQRKNRQLRSAQHNEEVEVPTGPDSFIETVVFRTACFTHDVLVGEPCYEVEGLIEGGNDVVGVCNDRAKRAGFNHPISAAALSMSARRPRS